MGPEDTVQLLPVPDRPVVVAAFGRDEETCHQLEMTLALGGYETTEIAVASLSQVIRRYRSLPPPPILIVDISGSPDPITELNELASFCPPSIRVFAVGVEDAIDLYRGLREIGVADYFVKPISPDHLLSTLLQNMREEVNNSHPARRGKVISVIPVRGGVGATALAANIGWGISHLLHRQTAIVDLDLAFGSLSIDLELDPHCSAVALLDEPSRLDSDMLSGPGGRGKLSLIASVVPDISLGQGISPEAVVALSGRLSQDVSYTVLDLPRCPFDDILPVLEASDCSVLVMDPRPACIRDMAEIVRQLPYGRESRAMVVLNRTRPVHPQSFSSAQIADAIGHAIEAEIPFEQQGLMTVLASATPAINRRGAAARRLRQLLADLTGLSLKQPWLTRLDLFRRGRYVR